MTLEPSLQYHSFPQTSTNAPIPPAAIHVNTNATTLMDLACAPAMLGSLSLSMDSVAMVSLKWKPLAEETQKAQSMWTS